MKQGDFTHFEIPADDPDRAKAFYSGLFEWSFSDPIPGLDGYHLFTTPVGQEGMGGAIGRRGEKCTREAADVRPRRLGGREPSEGDRARRHDRRAEGGRSRPGLVRRLPRYRGQRDRGLGVPAPRLGLPNGWLSGTRVS